MHELQSSENPLVWAWENVRSSVNKDLIPGPSTDSSQHTLNTHSGYEVKPLPEQPRRGLRKGSSASALWVWQKPLNILSAWTFKQAWHITKPSRLRTGKTARGFSKYHTAVNGCGWCWCGGLTHHMDTNDTDHKVADGFFSSIWRLQREVLDTTVGSFSGFAHFLWHNCLLCCFLQNLDLHSLVTCFTCWQHQ